VGVAAAPLRGRAAPWGSAAGAAVGPSAPLRLVVGRAWVGRWPTVVSSVPGTGVVAAAGDGLPSHPSAGGCCVRVRGAGAMPGSTSNREVFVFGQVLSRAIRARAAMASAVHAWEGLRLPVSPAAKTPAREANQEGGT